MHILGTHTHIHTKYEVSILNPVARRDDNYARRTNHDYIGSFGRIPNELKTQASQNKLVLNQQNVPFSVFP